LPRIVEARKRGVVFDAANGASHFAFRTALAAISQGFFPDVISSDVTVKTLYGEYVFGLPYLLSKYVSMGMGLEETVAACTTTPARLLGVEGKIGTLAPGAQADVSIFRLVNRQTTFQDCHGERFVGDWFLVPQLTICSGAVVYRQEGFE
jgi:predicted amidohydrolase